MDSSRTARRSFVRRLLRWGRDNRRSFVWRETTDVYRILVAEVLLRRSRATTVTRVLPTFFERWPSATDLSEAEVAEVQSVIRPLGLVSRAEHLVRMATELHDHSRGARALERLPGVGPYAARATVGLPVVDAVSARVYRRYFGLLDVASHREVDAELWTLVEEVTPEHRPREWNWAVLDLAAAVCLPKQPRCEECPLQVHCVYTSQRRAASS